MEEIVQEKLSEGQEKNKWMQKLKIDDFKFELILFFILGLLLGFTLKTEAVKKVTIGFSDYKISQAKQGYDFDQLKKELEDKIQKQQELQQQVQPQQ